MEENYFLFLFSTCSAPNKCELNCMPKGERFYFRPAKKVIDGTPCYDDGQLDVCVQGICLVSCTSLLSHCLLFVFDPRFMMADLAKAEYVIIIIIIS